MREEDVPAQHPQAQAEARLPAAHANPSGSRRAASSAREGPQPAVRLTWRSCDRADFRALAARPRRRFEALTLVQAPTTSGAAPAVAWAVGRRAGRAVVRNRIRRRLRAALRNHCALLEPGHAYLFGITNDITRIPFPVLDRMMGELLRPTENRP